MSDEERLLMRRYVLAGAMLQAVGLPATPAKIRDVLDDRDVDTLDRIQGETDPPTDEEPTVRIRRPAVPSPGEGEEH